MCDVKCEALEVGKISNNNIIHSFIAYRCKTTVVSFFIQYTVHTCIFDASFFFKYN